MKKTAILTVMLCLLLAFSACNCTVIGSVADSSSIVEPKSYTITYECNGGSEIEPANYGADEMPIKPEDPVLEGFNFLGWFLDAEFTNEFNFDYPLNQDTTLYAYFSDVIFISTAEQLIAIRDNVDAKYLLTADISLNGETWEPIETFNGELDGNGHKISYFLMSTEGALSGFIKTNNGTIKNVIFEEVETAHTSSVITIAGSIVGENNGNVFNCSLINSTISHNVYLAMNSGYVNSYVGALVGHNSQDARIISCVVDCSFNLTNITKDTSTYNIFNLHLWSGGICGLNDGTISDSKANLLVSITTQAIGDNDAGAIVRVAGVVSYNNGSIENCSTQINSDKFVSLGKYYERIDFGGIVNQNHGFIEHSNAEVKIYEEGCNFDRIHIGGVVYANYNLVNNCYALIDIKTTQTAYKELFFGGFVARNYGSIGSSYATGTIECTSLDNIMGGFVGVNGEGGAINGCISEVKMINTAQENFGAFVGRVDAGVTLKCFYSSATQMFVGEEVYEYVESVAGIAVAQAEEIFTADFIFGNLYWDEEIWQIDGENHPTLK